MTPIQFYTYTYPQLSLDIREGQSQSEEYLNIVRRCILPDDPVFPLKETGREERIEVNTPAGLVEALYLPDREIFERFAMALANRCEPEDIPRSTGAMMISGINNIRKYLAGESNYKDVILLISAGYYSNIPASKAGFDDDEWIDLSKKIRIFHESTHFIQRKLYPDHKEAIRDEVMADAIGIIGAVGHFDPVLLRIVLGIDEDTPSQEARIRNYVDEKDVANSCEYAKELIVKFDDFFKEYMEREHKSWQDVEPFELAVKIEECYIR